MLYLPSLLFFIIFYHSSVDSAVEWAHHGLFFNMGQCCCAGSRTYVHEDVYDEFAKKAIAKAQSRKVGNPYDPVNASGPQVCSSYTPDICRRIHGVRLPVHSSVFLFASICINS